MTERLNCTDDLAAPLLGKYLEKTINQKDPCTPMFVAALFTTKRSWKQPKCPSREEKKMFYVQSVDYYSAIKEQNNVFAAT